MILIGCTTGDTEVARPGQQEAMRRSGRTHHPPWTRLLEGEVHNPWSTGH